jgi:hypothetical protein
MSTDIDTQPNTAQTVADLVKTLYGADLLTLTDIDVGDIQVLLRPTPAGVQAESIKKFIDEYRRNPERRQGTATMKTLDSLIAHTNRFKDADSALFADPNTDKPSLTAVLDYHQQVNAHDGNDSDHVPLPRFGKHRSTHSFPLAEEWGHWTKSNEKPMTQTDFAEFIEERVLDIQPPPTFTGELSAPDLELQKITTLLKGKFAGPELLMELSRGLAVHESSKVASVVNLSSGAGSVTFESEHRDGSGEKLDVPNLFCIGIPVFEYGSRYRVVVRLRYRKTTAGIVWGYELYRHDRVFKDAFDEACTFARQQTGLPLFVGSPEA